MADVVDARVGAEPASVLWTVVRGDDAKLSLQFLDTDGSTPLNVTGWSYSSALKNGTTLVNLSTTTGASSTVVVHATNTQTAALEPGQYSFDLQVTKADTTVWTPLMGTIRVLPDVR
jgi:hypothetical protein